MRSRQCHWNNPVKCGQIHLIYLHITYSASWFFLINMCIKFSDKVFHYQHDVKSLQIARLFVEMIFMLIKKEQSRIRITSSYEWKTPMHNGFPTKRPEIRKGFQCHNVAMHSSTCIFCKLAAIMHLLLIICISISVKEQQISSILYSLVKMRKNKE